MLTKIKWCTLCAVLYLMHLDLIAGQARNAEPNSRHVIQRQGDQPAYLALLTKEDHNGQQVRDEICGGTIINEEWVLTAASCLEGGNLAAVLITVGQFMPQPRQGGNRRRPGQGANRGEYRSTEWYQHPDYAPNTDSFDIAIVRSLEKFAFNDHVEPAVVAHERDALARDSLLRIYGWVTGNRDRSVDVTDLTLRGGDAVYIRETGMVAYNDLQGNQHLNMETFLYRSHNHQQMTTSGDVGGPVARETPAGQVTVHGVIKPVGTAQRTRQGWEEKATMISAHVDKWLEEQVKTVTPKQTIHQNTYFGNPGFLAVLKVEYREAVGGRTFFVRCHGAFLSAKWVVTGRQCLDDTYQDPLNWMNNAPRNNLNSVRARTCTNNVEEVQASNWWRRNGRQGMNDVGLVYFENAFTQVRTFAKLPYPGQLAEIGQRHSDLGREVRNNMRLSHLDTFAADRMFEANQEGYIFRGARVKSRHAEFTNEGLEANDIRVVDGFTPYSAVVHYQLPGSRDHYLFGVEALEHNNWGANHFARIDRSDVRWLRNCMNVVGRLRMNHRERQDTCDEAVRRLDEAVRGGDRGIPRRPIEQHVEL